VIGAIDEGKSYGELAELIRFDGGLQASILRTANLTRFGALQHIETLPLALSMIGVEETKKLLMGKVMDELTTAVSQIGFEPADYFVHCATTAYLAQLLGLNLESPAKREHEILLNLRLPACVRDSLLSWRLWEKFPKSGAFDPFTGGILHDLGKLVNAVCYRGTWPLVLHEIERAKWRQSSLLECEAAVLGEFQHPGMAGALLQHWDMFPSCVEPIRGHHQVQAGTFPEAALLALANTLAKGISPFPRTIDIPKEYRKAHLDPVAEKEGLANPLPRLYQYLVDQFERNRETMGLSRDLLTADQAAPQTAQDLLQAAQTAVAQDGRAYLSVLIQQNPEFPSLQEWLKVPGEDLIAYSLVLRETLAERVQQLWQSIAPKKK
jgi:HD-like signal output (HDOD) protein